MFPTNTHRSPKRYMYLMLVHLICSWKGKKQYKGEALKGLIKDTILHLYSRKLLLLLLLSCFSCVRLCATPQTAAHHPSLGFSRQEHWSGLPSRKLQFRFQWKQWRTQYDNIDNDRSLITDYRLNSLPIFSQPPYNIAQ